MLPEIIAQKRPAGARADTNSNNSDVGSINKRVKVVVDSIYGLRASNGAEKAFIGSGAMFETGSIFLKRIKKKRPGPHGLGMANLQNKFL